MAQQKLIRLVTMRWQVQSLTLLSGLRIWHYHALWCRSQIWLGSWLLWLWCRPAAIDSTWPLAWEPPYAAGVALKSKKKKKKKPISTSSTTPRKWWLYYTYFLVTCSFYLILYSRDIIFPHLCIYIYLLYPFQLLHIMLCAFTILYLTYALLFGASVLIFN